MKDFLGIEIKVGDHIVYAALVGRCATLVHAEVVELREPSNEKWTNTRPLVVRPLQRLYDRDCDRLVYLQYPDRCLVIPKPVTPSS